MVAVDGVSATDESVVSGGRGRGGRMQYGAMAEKVGASCEGDVTIVAHVFVNCVGST